jgi:glyceraldehyde 3-phosphate dehydrogenase
MRRVAINGFGRIGRNFLRASLERRPDYEIVALNDLGDPTTMAHLLQFDSLLGRLPVEVVAGPETIRVGELGLRAFSIPEPQNLPWRDLDVDVVVEATGRFEQRDKAQAHLDAGARSVVISAVANDADVTLVLGVNDEAYDPDRHRIVSNASCTTNCVTPLAKVLHDAFGIERGFMTTVHAYTATQRVLDAPHKDLRRARAAAINLIPTTTGATRALGTVLPELEGRSAGSPSGHRSRWVRLSTSSSRHPGPSAATRSTPPSVTLPRTDLLVGSSATPTSRWSPVTSSALPTPAFSTVS